MGTGIEQEPTLNPFGRFRIHILIFLFVVFCGLTLTHPTILLTDEWITVNQLHQLYEGHQIVVNEGKYGLFENGTMTPYFSEKSNVLGYSLFLPLISLPAYWLINLFGEHFVFFILYLWTFAALILVLSVHYFFGEYSYIGKWRWTPPLTGLIFILFFINLYYYKPFPVIGSFSYPEVMAVVFTNVILLALASVLIYEINFTLFDTSLYSIFGTFTCLSSSSYFFWCTGCKDHILALLLVAGILLALVKFQKKQENWYIPLAFLLSGLLAWTRPELALWTFFSVIAVWGYTFIRQFRKNTILHNLLSLCEPLFTLIGASPFFLNNVLVTKNPLIPTAALYIPMEPADLTIHASPYLPQTGEISGTALFRIITIKNFVPSSNIFGDLSGILFYPQNGSISVLTLTPFFLVMVLLAAVLILKKKIRFSDEEKNAISVIVLIAISVFLAYFRNLYGLNTSWGINPDIRYLSPAYLPLTLMGLIIAHKVRFISENPERILKNMPIIGTVAIPVSLLLMAIGYADPNVSTNLNAPLATFFIIAIFTIAVITLAVVTWNIFTNRGDAISLLLISLLCIMPVIWQIDASVYVCLFSTGEGYPAWIPVSRIITIAISFPFNL